MFFAVHARAHTHAHTRAHTRTHTLTHTSHTHTYTMYEKSVDSRAITRSIRFFKQAR